MLSRNHKKSVPPHSDKSKTTGLKTDVLPSLLTMLGEGEVTGSSETFLPYRMFGQCSGPKCHGVHQFQSRFKNKQTNKNRPGSSTDWHREAARMSLQWFLWCFLEHSVISVGQAVGAILGCPGLKVPHFIRLLKTELGSDRKHRLPNVLYGTKILRVISVGNNTGGMFFKKSSM